MKDQFKESSRIFIFGSGEGVQSTQLVKLPSIIGGRRMFAETFVVNCESPILLGNDRMKKDRYEHGFW